MNDYNKIIKSFAKRVRELRLNQEISQEAFAQDAGIDRSYYGRIERGEANPTLKNIAGIADALGLEIHELFLEAHKPARKKRSR